MTTQTTGRKLGTRQADLLKRFLPNVLKSDDGFEHITPVFSNIEASRRKDKPWWPEMDSLLKQGLILIRKTSTTSILSDESSYIETQWQAATSWKGYKALKECAQWTKK